MNHNNCLKLNMETLDLLKKPDYMMLANITKQNSLRAS